MPVFAIIIAGILGSLGIYALASRKAPAPPPNPDPPPDPDPDPNPDPDNGGDA